MFFYASKLLSALIFPFPLFLLATAYMAFRLPPSRWKRAYFVLFAAILALSNSFCASRLFGTLEDLHPSASVAEAGHADAIVVLTGMTHPLAGRSGRVEFQDGADRILAALDLYRAGRAPVVLVSGGTGLILQNARSEAEALREWALARGFPAKAILSEPNSRNTAENAVETAKIAAERGWESVILVTSAFHMRRSVLCFRKAGVEALPFPVDYRTAASFVGPEEFFPSVAALSLSTIAIKEYLGIVAYWLTGRI